MNDCLDYESMVFSLGGAVVSPPLCRYKMTYQNCNQTNAAMDHN